MSAFPQVQNLVAKGKGHPSSFSQQRGDLYLTIELLSHSFFRFENDAEVED